MEKEKEDLIEEEVTSERLEKHADEVKPTPNLIESAEPVLEEARSGHGVSFKMPTLSGSTKHVHKKSSIHIQDPTKNKRTANSEIGDNSTPHELLKPKITTQLPYKEPEWGHKPPIQYSLEVLKNGQIVSNILLNNRSFSVFGRMEDCDIIMEHPSVSRYHAILQYRGEESTDNEKGFYVYDLESTHGTFLNKQQVRPRIYVKMQVGHILKLGGSSRMYILQGPEEEQEPEDEMTVTEIKAKRKQELLTQQEQENNKDKDADGIDWGFGEDAAEDPIAENPFAVSAPNEDLYLDDPKKTLRGWFEREGYELEYKVEEKGFSHFLCRIELPVDSTNGEAVFAEASVKGKKKEAVVAAALEACRVLDRHGVLRQSQHDSRKRKEKDWESQDFYDSEEDTYLDRTGTIERKRQFRKRLVKREDEQEHVETYDSLVIKLKEKEQEILEVQNKLQQSCKKSKSKDELEAEQDSLEAFMANLQNVTSIDKKEKSQLWLKLSMLQQDKLRLEKLVRIAQPTVLPPLQPATSAIITEAKKNLLKTKLMPMIGSMKGRASTKSKKPLVSKPQIVKNPIRPKDTDIEEEEEEEEEVEEEEKDKVEKKEEIIQNSVHVDQDILNASIQSKGSKTSLVPHDGTLKEPTEVFEEGHELKNSENILERVSVNFDDPETSTLKANLLGPAWTPEEKTEEKKKRQRKMNLKKAKYDKSNPDYAMWLPPDNQTGDGKTFLNDKFGY